jgi:hypothetical protein
MHNTIIILDSYNSNIITQLPLLFIIIMDINKQLFIIIIMVMPLTWA